MRKRADVAAKPESELAIKGLLEGQTSNQLNLITKYNNPNIVITTSNFSTSIYYQEQGQKSGPLHILYVVVCNGVILIIDGACFLEKSIAFL